MQLENISETQEFRNRMQYKREFFLDQMWLVYSTIYYTYVILVGMDFLGKEQFEMWKRRRQSDVCGSYVRRKCWRE